MPVANPDAYLTQILNVLQTTVQGLSLVYNDASGTPTSLPSGQVYVKKLLTDRIAAGVALPAVVLFYGNLPSAPDYEASDFEDTMIDYAIGVATLFASNQDLAVNNDELYWLQQILNAFLDLPAALTTALTSNVADACEFMCQVELKPPVDPESFHERNLDVGGMILRIKTAYSRGR